MSFEFLEDLKVPLLVSEYVLNDSLLPSLQTWKLCISFLGTRLRIACETAGAITRPIIHRDVMKSSNILLDQNYTAKVSDFGAFRVMPMDKDYGLGLALKKKKKC